MLNELIFTVSTRVRRCYGGPSCCSGKSSEIKSCGVPDPSCLADTCEPWSTCCPSGQGGLTGQRSRSCQNPIYQNDPRVAKEESCQLEGVANWTEWSACSVSVGEGRRSRSRSVPGCENSLTESETCLEQIIIKSVGGTTDRSGPVQCEISD